MTDLTFKQRQGVLNGDLSLDGIVRNIKNGKIKNIVVLTGGSSPLCLLCFPPSSLP